MSGARLNSDGHVLGAKEALNDLVKNSIFCDFVKDIEVFDQAQGTSNSGSNKECMRILSNHTSVISGLKCFLMEQASDLYVTISEDFFNLEAKPFKPKETAPQSKIPAGIVETLRPKVEKVSDEEKKQ